MPWKPVLSGEPARRALESALEIGDEIRNHLHQLSSPSFAGGSAGLALFFGYLSFYDAEKNRDRNVRLCFSTLERALDQAVEEETPAGFFNGFTGVAWTCKHLQTLLNGEDRFALDGVDEVLIKLVSLSPFPLPFDLIYGLTGFGLYILDHPDRSFSDELFSKVVDRIEEAYSRPDFRIGCSSIVQLPGRGDGSRPEGRFDLGVAHGVAGLVGMLSAACAQDLGGMRACNLLRASVERLTAYRRGASAGSAYPGIVEDGRAPSCRSGWCYGDPGVASVLWSASQVLGEEAWEREALEVAGVDCARSPEDAGVIDGGLCHGTAGLGHIYNRLYQATGQEMFAHSARAWFDRTLDLRRKPEGIAGYRSWWPEKREWRSDLGLLTGAAGIGLALLGAVGDIAPDWDRPFLVA